MSEMIVDGLDIYRFPRGVPDDLVVIDAFPLHPIPEQLEPVKADLLGQLALAHAPISGRRTACILAGEHKGYGGHVVEHSQKEVEDPFMMALEKVPPSEHLYGIMVTGQGPIKEKHVLPSGAAYDAIALHLIAGAPIVVIPPNEKELCRFVPDSMHRAAYEPKSSSVFQGKTIFESQIEAIRYTALSVEDCAFVARLRHAGLKDGIHYFLTGSSNGQSGPSFATRPGMYSDLDIIAVSQLDRAQAEAAFEASSEMWYGKLEKAPKIVRTAGSDRAIEGCVYSGTSGISIDFFASSTPEEVFVRPEYFERNYFHQLS